MKKQEKMSEQDDDFSMLGRIFLGGLLIFALMIVNFGGNAFYHHFFDQEPTVHIVYECECDCCEDESK